MTPPSFGVADTLAPGLCRVLAPNPGPMTHWGTNTYILGEAAVAVIDPGPQDPAHLDALLAITAKKEISHILVTHAHADHSPLATTLSKETGAPVFGFGPPEAGRSATMAKLADAGLSGGGEGIDAAFQPDVTLSEGDVVEGGDWSVRVLHTPGHFAGHLAFHCDHGVISGDHVMDWASSLVSPPDGDIAAFMATSQRLLDIGPKRLFPGHGHEIADPQGRLAWLMDHRRNREAAILKTLGPTFLSLNDITKAVYTDINPNMLPAAARNVFAHLIDLVERNIAEATPELGVSSMYRRA